jgi:hypothetical protein
MPKLEQLRKTFPSLVKADAAPMLALSGHR